MPAQPGCLRLLNPLSIRFSQPRIALHFRDGHMLDETGKEVFLENLDAQPAFDVSSDADDGPPPYDMVIQLPFPVIRVISWMPKLRGADGEAERDSNGDQILGKRAWFALDNRRLWSMQNAAAKVWPKRCCAVVRCIEDVPGTTIRELRKFRTTTEGKQIELGVRCGETTPWMWCEAAPDGARFEEDSIEGLFAEDLWDAHQWAPKAAASALEKDPEETVPRNSSAYERAIAAEENPEPQAAAPTRNGTTTNGGYGYPTSGPRPAAATPSPAAWGGGYAGGRRGEPATCPEAGWQYVDPAGATQGPFDRKKMRLWHEHNFFYPDLLMRSNAQDAFVPFKVLFPQPTEPFLGVVMRYKLQ